MNAFEVAVLRILIKRQQPLKLSTLVSGFPDDCEDAVLSALSSLKLQGYIMPYDSQPDGYLSINRDRRKEILKIVGSDISTTEPSGMDGVTSGQPISNDGRKSLGQIMSWYHISPRARAIAILSLFFFGLASAIGSNLPTTSPETEFVAYHHSHSYDHWDAYGASDHGNYKLSSADNESPAALKDCGQKTLQS